MDWRKSWRLKPIFVVFLSLKQSAPGLLRTRAGVPECAKIVDTQVSQVKIFNRKGRTKLFHMIT